MTSYNEAFKAVENHSSIKNELIDLGNEMSVLDEKIKGLKFHYAAMNNHQIDLLRAKQKEIKLKLKENLEAENEALSAYESNHDSAWYQIKHNILKQYAKSLLKELKKIIKRVSLSLQKSSSLNSNLTAVAKQS